MTQPYYSDGPVTLYYGDCIDIIRELPDHSIDAVVTDPPYGLEFMGREWDRFTPGQFQHWCELWATEAFRVLKPGGHLLAFGGTRTWHRLTAGIEDAGFEIRDSIAWLYGSGFPKSLDVSKAIDKAAGATRETTGPGQYAARGRRTDNAVYGEGTPSASEVNTIPATPDAERWEGWGTALKPAFEPIVVARKPLAGTVAANVLAHGTGALNIDASRIAGPEPDTTRGSNVSPSAYAIGAQGRILDDGRGRWPANLVLDESQAAALDEQSGTSRSTVGKPRNAAAGTGWGMTATGTEYKDSGGASRFFYTAKAPGHERPEHDGTSHPTVKPLNLMQWLCRLVTPPGGTILEPFAGSGTTIEAAIREHFNCIAIEKEAEYMPLIEKRIRKSHHVGFDFGDWDGGVA